ncbi:MAG: hypothetical protein AMXMBFR48_15270 [Ignavibacteriales bacterium]
MNKRYVNESVAHLREIHAMLNGEAKDHLKAILITMGADKGGGVRSHLEHKDFDRLSHMSMDLLAKTPSQRKRLKYASEEERLLVVWLAFELLKTAIGFLDTAADLSLPSGGAYREISRFAAEYAYQRSLREKPDCDFFEEFESPLY